MKILLRHTIFELRLTFRQGEQVLVTLLIPLALLLFLSNVAIGEIGGRDSIGELTPRVLALALFSAAFTSLGISTGFERSYGVLKRLGASPLGSWRLIFSKALVVAMVEFVQIAMLLSAASLLGWRATLGALFVPGILLSTVAFAGMSLALAGVLPALVNLAVTNALYVALTLFGGVIVPPSQLPEPLATLARFLPTHACVQIFEAALRTDRTGAAPSAWLVLGVWSVASVFFASCSFKWE